VEALALFGVFLAIGVIAYLVLDQAHEKATVRSTLRQLDGYEVDNIRDRELLDSLGTRTIAPLLGRLTELGRRYTPQTYVEGFRTKLASIGYAGDDALDRFLALRVVTIAAVPVWFILAFFVLPLTGKMPLLVFGMLSAVSLLGPDAVVNRKVDERKTAIVNRLPDVLDLLTISVEAGLGFEQALDRVIDAVPGPLSDEFARMLGEVRAGANRRDALRALDQRVDVPELRSFVLAILQADSFGVSIGRVLRAQADEMRIKRRQLAQERAQKAPVKMLVPMVFCIFPALFVVVLGPAIINISRSL
jgi:tight adherence protein C